MKKDPNNYCIVYTQSLFWAIIHDLIAHPMMAITNYTNISIRFHDFTSNKAWKRN